jgi:hypothetical protein
VSHISRPRCWGKSALPSRSSGIFLSSDGEGRRLEDLGRTKINRVFGRPLAEPLNVSECASLAEPPKTLLQQPLQLWRTLLLNSLYLPVTRHQNQEFLGQLQVSTGTATIVQRVSLSWQGSWLPQGIMSAAVGWTRSLSCSPRIKEETTLAGGDFFERWAPSKYRTAPSRCPLAKDLF